MSKKMKQLTDANFKEAIAKGVTLVDFHATWCGPCKVLSPILDELEGKIEGKAEIAKLDIDQAQDVTATYGVTSVPTIILFKDGKELKRIVGVKDVDYLYNLIQSQA